MQYILSVLDTDNNPMMKTVTNTQDMELNISSIYQVAQHMGIKSPKVMIEPDLSITDRRSDYFQKVINGGLFRKVNVIKKRANKFKSQLEH
jgi:hypothetical protein